MGENSAIEWCDATFNPWHGCTKVSPGCDHCYAEAWAKRTGFSRIWDGPERRTFGAKHWADPIKWNAKAKKEGKRLKVFCASMADVFDKDGPTGARADLWDLIEDTPHLDWLVLTKRVGNVMKMIPAHWQQKLPANVWVGISVVNQVEADRDIPKLFEIPAAVRFLSCEPLLGPIDLDYPKSVWPHGPPMCCSGYECGCRGKPVDPPLIWGINWVIVGGESGHHARPMLEQWAGDIRGDCAAHRVPFFFKQGSQANWPHFKAFESFPEALQVREWPAIISSEQDTGD